MTPPARSQRGVAMVMAMLIAALATAVAVAASARQFIETRRAANLMAADRIELVVAALERDATAVLRNDSVGSRHDALDETWATGELVAEIPGARASGQLQDLHARFNINALVMRTGQSGTGAGPTAPNARAGTADRNTPGPSAARAAANRNAGIPAGPAIGADNVAANALVPAPDRPADVPVQIGIQRQGEVYQPAFGGGYEIPLGAPTSPAPAPPRSDGTGLAAIGQASAATATATAGAAAVRAGPAAPSVRSAATPNRAAAPTSTAPAAAPAGAPPAGTGTGGARMVRDADTALLQFRRLLENADVDPGIAQAVLDWLDPDSDTRFPNGAEDDYYLRLEQPYRAANTPMASVRELLLVRGVTPEVFERLAPLLTASRADLPVNVNTAPAELLMSLGPGVDSSTADMIIRTRNIQPFLTNQDFLQHPLLQGRLFPGVRITTASEHFRLDSQAIADRIERRQSSFIARSRPGGNATLARRLAGGLDD